MLQDERAYVSLSLSLSFSLDSSRLATPTRFPSRDMRRRSCAATRVSGQQPSRGAAVQDAPMQVHSNMMTQWCLKIIRDL